MKNKFKIEITKNAEKFIKKQDKLTQARIINAVLSLPEGDVIKLKGYTNFFRLRIGDVRVIFEKIDNELKIIIIDIGSRGQIYNNY